MRKKLTQKKKINPNMNLNYNFFYYIIIYNTYNINIFPRGVRKWAVMRLWGTVPQSAFNT